MNAGKFSSIAMLVVIIVVNVEASFLSYVINGMHAYTVGYTRNIFYIFEVQSYVVYVLIFFGLFFRFGINYFVCCTVLNVVSVVGGAVDYWMWIR